MTISQLQTLLENVSV